MMNVKRFCLILILAIAAAGCAMPLKMAPAPTFEPSGFGKLPHKAGLYIPADLKTYVFELATSPVDKMAYPIGDQTTQFFEKNLPLVFQSVTNVDSKVPPAGVDLVLEPSLVKFDAVVPMPAYNPYTATAVYRVDVFDKKGEKIFTQTATGNHQTSKGMMSGFSAREICAEVAQKAMADAVRQILEGISEAEEIKTLVSAQ